jgi:RNase H-fold protein (predicted Holliday junction resolvase)
MKNKFNILAIDPGRLKWGAAILDPHGNILARGIHPVDSLYPIAAEYVKKHHVERIALGNQTNSQHFKAELESLSVDLILVDESYSSEEARVLFFEINPPQGIKRWIPKGLLSPNEPYDDITAVVIGRRMLE